VKRQFGEIDVIAFDDHLMDRGLGRGYLDHWLRIVHPARVFVHEVALVGAERGSETTAAARHRGHHFVLLGADPLEVFGLGRGLDHRAQVGERNRFLMHLHLADRDQLLDEAAQAKFIEIDVAGGCNLVHHVFPLGSISLDELITAWMLRAYSIAPVTSMSSAARA